MGLRITKQTHPRSKNEQVKEQYINLRQEADTPEKCYTNTDSISKFENKDKPAVIENDKIRYFLPGPNRDNDKRESAEITQLQREFKDIFNRIGCFD